MLEKEFKSEPDKSIFKLITGSVFLLNAVIFFFQALTKSIFPPLLLPLREAFLIDNTEVGLLVTLVFFGYALARYPSGILADIYGCAWTVLLGSVAMALSFFAIAFAPNYQILAIITFIMGASSGIYVTAGYTLAVVICSREKAATATSAFEIFGVLSGITAPVLVTFFVLFLNWQLLFIAAGLLLAVVTVIFYQKRDIANRYENRYAHHNGIKTNDFVDSKALKIKLSFEKSLSSEIKKSFVIFRDPLIRRFLIWSTLVGGFGALSWTGINSFIPTFLVEVRGYSYNVANQIFIIVAIAGLSAKIATGWLADRYGNNPVLLTNLVLSIFLFSALTQVSGHVTVLLVLAMLGAACYNTNTLINAYVLRNMPPRYQGAGFGLFCTGYTIIYSFGPYLTGFFSDQFGLITAIRLSSFGAIVAVFLILAASRLVPHSLVENLSNR